MSSEPNFGPQPARPRGAVEKRPRRKLKKVFLFSFHTLASRDYDPGCTHTILASFIFPFCRNRSEGPSLNHHPLFATTPDPDLFARPIFWNMRPLTEEETKTLFLKLSEYIGRSIERMINRTDERHCFRLLKDRVYYVSESSLKAAAPISRDHLLHFGTCIGKFTKSGKFRLHITALDYLAQYAKVSKETYLILRHLSWLPKRYNTSQILSTFHMKYSTKFGWNQVPKCPFYTGTMCSSLGWRG